MHQAWDPCLTQSIHVDLPPWRRYSSTPKIPGYSQITALTPIIKHFMPTVEGEGQLAADNLFGKVEELDGAGVCMVTTTQRKKKKAFCKVTHILDPIRSMQGYYEHPEKGERRKQEKLKEPMNKA